MFNNGIIIQFGSYSTNIITYKIIFPIAFSNNKYGCACSTNRNQSGLNGFNHIGDKTPTGATCVFDNFGGAYIFIGY